MSRENRFKIDRRTNANILSKSKSPIHTKNYGPGQHGNRKKVVSEYGKRLLEVAKLRHFYGDIKFHQFKSIFKFASSKKIGAVNRADDNLIGILESRLSTVVYRAKFANSPFAAKQLVSHKHVLVNGKCVNISSYRVKVGDVVELKEDMKNNDHVIQSLKSNERVVPNHIMMESSLKCRIQAQCTIANTSFAFPLKIQSIIEYMSRYI